MACVHTFQPSDRKDYEVCAMSGYVDNKVQYKHEMAPRSGNFRGRGLHLLGGAIMDKFTPPHALTHGHTTGRKHSPTYSSWLHLRQRCNNPKNGRWHSYGGRGIRVCQRWNEFAPFLADLGQRPDSQHSIDRIDNDGHYSCGRCEECIANRWLMNCRWATREQQYENTRATKRILVGGKLITLREAAELSGLSKTVIKSRLELGMSPEMAVFRPFGVKLKADDVRAIRQAYANGEGTYRQLAPRFGVVPHTIGCIVRREIWKRVE